MGNDGPLQRVRRVLYWARGTPVEVWRYASRSVPLYRTSVQVHPDEELLDASLLDERLGAGVQPAACGTGPEFRRSFAARIVGVNGDAERVMRELSRDFASTTPEGICEVDQPDGSGRLVVGDDVRIKLAGPWDAPVRVVDTTRRAFRFATLDGHMEAGEIEFRAMDEAHGVVVLEIESWARSATRAFAALYHHLGIAKEVQLHMWATVIERVAERSGGTIDDGIRVITRQRDTAHG